MEDNDSGYNQRNVAPGWKNFVNRIHRESIRSLIKKLVWMGKSSKRDGKLLLFNREIMSEASLQTVIVDIKEDNYLTRDFVTSCVCQLVTRERKLFSNE